MFGDILRREEDVVDDIERLNNICQEWKHYKQMLGVVITHHNIKEINPCPEHELYTPEQLKCSRCKGTGYVIEYKENNNE